MLGFVSTDNESLVSCLGDPQRAVAAYRELLRRDQSAVGAIRAGLHHEHPAVREGCCRLLDHLVDTDSMDQLIAMADDPDAQVRIAAFHALACDRCKDSTCAPDASQVLEESRLVHPRRPHLPADPPARRAPPMPVMITKTLVPPRVRAEVGLTLPWNRGSSGWPEPVHRS